MYPPFARIFHFSAKIVREPLCDVHIPPLANDFRQILRTGRNVLLGLKSGKGAMKTAATTDARPIR